MPTKYAKKGQGSALLKVTVAYYVYPWEHLNLADKVCQKGSRLSLAAPVLSVKTSELHRLGDVGLVDNLGTVHVRDSPRDF